MSETATLTMALTRPAKSRGGDRYECDYGGERISVYVPQNLSRTNGTPAKLLTVTFAPYTKD